MSSPSRRPAYSCTEYRRRKVRCKPCGKCTAHSLASLCTYEDGWSLPVYGMHNAIHSEEQEERTHSTLEQPLPNDTSPHPSTTSGRIQGTVSKTRVFGNGHWMSTFSLVGFHICLNSTCPWFPSDKPKVEGLSVLQPLVEYYDMLFGESNQGPQDQITQAVDQCKRLARDVKKQRPSRRCLPADMHRSLPRREVADELVQLYFTTFESCYQILYFLLFKAQYESCIDCPEVAEISFLLQTYLILSLAGTLHDNPTVPSRDDYENANLGPYCSKMAFCTLGKRQFDFDRNSSPLLAASCSPSQPSGSGSGLDIGRLTNADGHADEFTPRS